MTAPLTAADEHRRAQQRKIYARDYSTCHGGRSGGPAIPDDITVHDRDPCPCFFCETRAGVACRHRPGLRVVEEVEVDG